MSNLTVTTTEVKRNAANSYGPDSMKFVKPILTDQVVSWMQEDTDYFWRTILPVLPINKSSVELPYYNREDWYRSDPNEISQGTERDYGNLGKDKKTVTLKNFQFGMQYTDFDVRDSDDWEDWDNDMLDACMQQMNIFAEGRVGKKFFVNNAFGSSGNIASPTNKWNGANSTPLDTVDSAIITLTDRAYRQSDLFIAFNWKVAKYLTRNEQILDAVNGGATVGEPSFRIAMEMLREAFGIDVYISSAHQNTGPRDSEDLEYIIPDHAIIAAKGTRDGNRLTRARPSFGVRLIDSGLSGLNSEGMVVRRITTEENPDIHKISLEMGFGVDSLFEDAGVIIQNVIS